MGLAEYINSGMRLTRDNITFQTNDSGTGSVDLGSAYILLGINTTAPCRIRFYDNQESLMNLQEQTRTFDDRNISASIALVGDFNMTAAGTYTVDPVVYGVISVPTASLTHFKVDNTGSGLFPTVTVNRYLLENSSINISNRVTLPSIQQTLSPDQIKVGTLSTSIPRTYLLVSCSLSDPTHLARLRLYSDSSALSNSAEISRSFATESVERKLIVDAILSGNEIAYFTPKIVGANLQYAGSNLLSIANNRTSLDGESQLYYALQNVSTTGGAQSIEVSLHMFSLED
jgi:hypothetical protein